MAMAPKFLGGRLKTYSHRPHSVAQGYLDSVLRHTACYLVAAREEMRPVLDVLHRADHYLSLAGGARRRMHPDYLLFRRHA